MDSGLLSIEFYGEKNTLGESEWVAFTENGIRHEGYTYTVEALEDNALQLTFTNLETGDVRTATLSGLNALTIETGRSDADSKRGKREYVPVSVCELEDLPVRDGVLSLNREQGKLILYAFDFDCDGMSERLAIDWDDEDGVLRVQDGPLEWKADGIDLLNSVYLIDLDPQDGRANLLLCAEKEDEKEQTYELHVENGALVCGQVTDGYCFLTDSPEQELTLGIPTDLFGAKYGYREVKGEALEPVDDRLLAAAVIDAVAFGSREKNIEDGTLLHLVRVLPCEIDGAPGTLEPDVYIYLREWNESLTEIVFMAEDDRWITVHPDEGLMLDGVSLYEYFDNVPGK